MRRYFFLPFFFLLSACTYSNNLESKLAGRGPLALSDANPYIASNILLAEKIRDNSAVGGFIKYKGLPKAIEVKRSMFPPADVIIYYPLESEAYNIEGSGKDTIVTGPVKITPDQLSKIDQITRIYSGAPLIMIDDVPYNQNTYNNTQSIGTVSEINAPIPAANNELDMIKRLQSEPNLPLTEVSPKGDIVHYVTYEGETLPMVTLWYTYDKANLGRITRLNNLTRTGALEIGDTIFIPKYMVKSQIKLTEKAVNILPKE